MKTRLSLITALGLYWFVASPIAHAQQIKADTGGVAISGNVSGSTISIGIPAEQLAAIVRQANDLSEMQKEQIAKLKSDLDLNQRQIYAALNILGENNVPPERLGAKLVEIAERFKALQATASAQPGDGPRIAALKADVQKAIDAGELAKADALLADVETEQRGALDRLAVNAADTSAQRGEIALTRLRYKEGAMHFANAVSLLPEGSANEDKRIDYLRNEYLALYLQGNEFEDRDALLSALGLAKRILALTTRERVPLAWAESQVMLGLALAELGKRETGTTKLDEAVVAYREALKEYTTERDLLNWGSTQNHLGRALVELGMRESGTTRLEEAVNAHHEVLRLITREREPLGWAAAQARLGRALFALGGRESGTATLVEAIVAYREALKERTRERLPRLWAVLQSDLGAALNILGQRENNPSRLEEAIAAYREALKFATQEDDRRYGAYILGALRAARESLGYVRFRKGEYAAAALDLQEAVDGTDAYPMIWLYLARARTGRQNAKRDLEQGSAGLEQAQWPFSVIKLFLEQSTPEAMVASANKPEERCEAQFYLGQWHLLRDERANSIEALRNAVESCPKDFIEYAGALAELKRLAQ
ncbi:hypothetical protein [Bradyrhizobium sp. LeoA1S1]